MDPKQDQIDKTIQTHDNRVFLSFDPAKALQDFAQRSLAKVEVSAAPTQAELPQGPSSIVLQAQPTSLVSPMTSDPVPQMPDPSSAGPAGISGQWIVQVNNSGTAATVVAPSQCLASYTDQDFLSISGVGSALPLSGTDEIWLEVDVAGSGSFPYVLSNATIKSLGNGDSFNSTIENDGGVGSPPVYSQTKARMVIAYVNSGFVTQCRTSQMRFDQGLILQSMDASGGSLQTVMAAFAFSI